MRSISLAYMIINLPYTALRAFEVVVRRASFSAAAEELGVSQSAVSQHVKSLEEWVGQDLLTRGARKSTPTRDGLMLAQAIADGLGRISDVCADLRSRQRSKNTIVISCLPGFAFIWLFPRLMRFDLAHPHLSISIATDTGQDKFGSAQADLGIRYGFGDNPGFHVEKLMEERIFPVCAPALLQGAAPLTCPADLAHHTLLQDDNAQFGPASPDWDFWARSCQLHLPDPARTRRFGQSNMVLQAAIEGMGVAMGREPLVADALIEGRLVRPFDHVAKSHLAYWLVHRRGAESSRKIAEFVDWIHDEARTQPDIPAPVLSA